MIKGIAKLIIALNSNVKRTQIAAGFSWGVLFGILPVGAFWIVLFVVSMFFRHNQNGKIFTMALVKLTTPFLYPLTDQLGWAVLHIDALTPYFTAMYNTPFVPFTKFNNTLVAGGITAGLILWLPVFALITLLIPLYRNRWLPRIASSKIAQSVQHIPIVNKLIAAFEYLSAMEKNLL